MTLNQDSKEVREPARLFSGKTQNKQPVQGPWGRTVSGLLEEQAALHDQRGMKKKSEGDGQRVSTGPDPAGPYRESTIRIFAFTMSELGKQRGLEQRREVV